MKSRVLTVILAALACASLLGSLALPIWQMRLEAPQYQGEEALQVKIYPGSMRGDLNELKVLNSYIGVTVPDTLPQFEWLPLVLAGAGILGLVTAVLPMPARRRGLLLVATVLLAALVTAAAQAQWQMYRIGHERAAKTKLVGVKDFTPPFLGRAKVAQFTVSSTLSWGALLVGLGLGLQLVAAWLNRTPQASAEQSSAAQESSHLDKRFAAGTSET